LLPLPPATIFATASATDLTSAPPRLDQPSLHLGTPASSSAASPLLQHNYFAWLLGRPTTMWAWAEPFGSGPPQKTERKYVRPRSTQPFWANIGPIIFWVSAWPSYLGQPGPPVLIIFN
jgi:hypothetical protein